MAPFLLLALLLLSGCVVKERVRIEPVPVHTKEIIQPVFIITPQLPKAPEKPKGDVQHEIA